MIPKLAAPPVPTPEVVRGDLPHVIEFLTRLEASHPGHVGEALLPFLEAALSNDLALSMLTAALTGPPRK